MRSQVLWQGWKKRFLRSELSLFLYCSKPFSFDPKSAYSTQQNKSFTINPTFLQKSLQKSAVKGNWLEHTPLWSSHTQHPLFSLRRILVNVVVSISFCWCFSDSYSLVPRSLASKLINILYRTWVHMDWQFEINKTLLELTYNF